MDKRALSAIPRPALTDKNKEMPLLVSNMCYLATASRQEIGGNDTLIINFFREEEKGVKTGFPYLLPDGRLHYPGSVNRQNQMEDRSHRLSYWLSVLVPKQRKYCYSICRGTGRDIIVPSGLQTDTWN